MTPATETQTNQATRPGQRAAAVAALAALGVVVPHRWPMARIRGRAATLSALVRETIAEHERHAGAYCWRPRGNASARRRAEYDDTYTVGAYTVRQYHHESCRNVYYRLIVTRPDGSRGTVRDLRQIERALREVAK